MVYWGDVLVMWVAVLQCISNGSRLIIVSNQRRDIDLYPPELRSTIDEINAWIYEKINNGVYRVRCG